MERRRQQGDSPESGYGLHVVTAAAAAAVAVVAVVVILDGVGAK